MQQFALDDALRATRDGMREEGARMAGEMERLEAELARMREEMEHHRLVAEAVEREMSRRSTRNTAAVPAQARPAPVQAPALTVQQPPAPAKPAEPGFAQRVLTALEVEAMRGTTRRATAARVLCTLGRSRPVRATDVAKEHGDGSTQKAGREGARHGLLALAAMGMAVRLPDGSFLPAGSPLLPASLTDPEPASARSDGEL
ncbi:hypothetical protein KDL01_24195 [Actinospica durhamensis]|uniref:Uncharacterized protein n=1 Tax=Actinospica durhamensis TaxID=1508375 RepID=A0A941ESA4_9ACTN|nr:hypothetical protein [Actinospica durhamensis]MBR7836401.1 hypothetical protein [Actinospica durhamensis]